jgi:hypothetical protein
MDIVLILAIEANIMVIVSVFDVTLQKRSKGHYVGAIGDRVAELGY